MQRWTVGKKKTDSAKPSAKFSADELPALLPKSHRPLAGLGVVELRAALLRHAPTTFGISWVYIVVQSPALWRIPAAEGSSFRATPESQGAGNRTSK